MYYHPQKRIAFLAHPRTGSQAVAKALRRVGFEEVGQHHDGPDVLEEAPRLTFAVIRNHWDTVVSHAFFRAAKWREPLEWSVPYLERVLRPNAAITRDRLFVHTGEADRLLRYERLQSELDALLIGEGVKRIDVPRWNVSPQRRGRAYPEFLSDRLVQWVGRRYEREIEELGQ